MSPIFLNVNPISGIKFEKETLFINHYNNSEDYNQQITTKMKELNLNEIKLKKPIENL